MRGTALPALPSRVKGRASLVRRLRDLLIAAHRFDRGRARTAEDRAFAARLIDGLTETSHLSMLPSGRHRYRTTSRRFGVSEPAPRPAAGANP